MTVRNRGSKEVPHWHYDFEIRGRRYRRSVPEARTKSEAVQAETAMKRRVFEGTYGAAVAGSELFTEFADKTYMPWAKTNKRTWRNDECIVAALNESFRGKKLREVSPLTIEKLKRALATQTTKRGTVRAPASVNMVLSVGSSIFTLACDMEAASTNPFRKVKKLAVDNHQIRYLGWDEEQRLLEVLTSPPVKVRARGNHQQGAVVQIDTAIHHVNATDGAAVFTFCGRDGNQGARLRSYKQSGHRSSKNTPTETPTQIQIRVKAQSRAHLRDAIPIAIGTGLRRREQTTLRARQCDFARNVVVVEKSKSNRMREVPMNDDVRAILQRLCKGKRPDEFLFINKQTKRPYLDFRTGFTKACTEAGINGLSWKALRHTFGTRLGEAGHNAFDIADLMGHSDVRTSMRYVHSTDRRKHEAVQSTMLSRRATA